VPTADLFLLVGAGRKPPATGRKPPATGRKPPATGRKLPAIGRKCTVRHAVASLSVHLCGLAAGCGSGGTPDGDPIRVLILVTAYL
jgi:hypothetical protein